MASFAVRVRCYHVALALSGFSGGFLAGCAPSPATLSSGVVHVSFTSDETCGFSNPYTVEARGCRRLDRNAVMCKGFGVIDGVLFAGGCEAPAELELLDTQGTMPLSPPRSDATEQTPGEGASPAAPAQPEESEPARASAEPPPAAEKKARSSAKRSSKKVKKKPKRKRKKAAPP